ncbi:unnamed protein product, partial [Rotaria sp. Silwood1]
KIETNIIHRFIIESDYLGYIYKIKIRHNYYQLLEKIQINDDKQIFTFYSQQSLSINKDDSNIEQIFYEKDYQGLIINKESFEEYIPYIIKIKTGQSYDAGTSANVFIRLIGSKGRQTSRIELKVMHRQYFQPGKIETFSLEDIDIGDVNMIEIEHNGYNIDDDWFIDDIIIEMPTKQRTFYFICNQWLSLYKGDRKTKRLFKLQDLNKESFHSLIPYIVKINTGNIENSDIDWDISLKLFGTIDSSSEYIIKKDQSYFQRSTINVFQCQFEDVGIPIKLRVRLLPLSKYSQNQWYLENIQLIKYPNENLREETYLFELNDWIGQERDYYIDIPIKKDYKLSNNRTTYRIITKTSDIDNANCQYGQSDKLELKYSSTYIKKFQRNHEDIFTFENLINLGQLNKLIIWHDDSSILKSSWYLDYVKIDDIQTGETYMFICNKWLSSTKDDRKILRELFSNNHSDYKYKFNSLKQSQLILYQIEIYNSDKLNVDITQYQWIIIQGNNNTSEKIFIKNIIHNNILTRGQMDKFTFEYQPLGKLRSIIIGHEEPYKYTFKTYENYQETIWNLSHIIITDLSTDIKYEFPVRKWIDINYDDYIFNSTNKKEYSICQEHHRRIINYKIIVHTGYVSDAGINANVSIILYGNLDNTGYLQLKQNGQHLFQCGSVDEFIFQCFELGKLTKLHIEHNNSMSLSDWYIEKIEVINMHTNEIVVFPCKQSLGKKHHDHETQQDLLPIYTS